MNVLELFRPIKTFVFDIDGVLTNSQLLATEEGNLLRSVNIKDGYAIQLAVKKGYNLWIISGGTSAAMQTRFQNLGMKEVHIKVKDKKPLFNDLISRYNVAQETLLYMGDDMPDLAVMQECGLPVCPADACPEIKRFLDKIIEMGKFQSELYLPVRPSLFPNAVLQLHFGRKFKMFRDVAVDERNKPLLVEVIGDALAVLNIAITVIDGPSALSSKLDVGVAANDGLGRGYEWFRVDESP